MFLDETGFLTVPYGKSTWAMAGQTPYVRHRLRHRLEVTVLGSLTLSPTRRRCGLYAEFLSGRSVKAKDLIGHLGRLRRALGTSLVVVLDNLNQHKSSSLVEWCAKVGDVHLESLPPYAPELNPIEPAWSHGKNVTAAGRAVDTAEVLKALAEEAVTAANKQSLLRGFIRSTGLPIQFDLTMRKDPT